MTRFVPVDRETQYLFPPSVQEWLPDDHLARFIVDVVEQLDLSALEQSYAGRGSDAHHPAMLVALLLYGYATGTFSSRALERASYDSIAVRYISANTHPDHDTINSFRKRFLKQIAEVFVQVLCYAQVMGILKLGTVSLDGTKLHANASRHKAMSYGYAKKLQAKLKKEVTALLKRAEAANARDLPEGLNIPRSWPGANSAWRPLPRPSRRSKPEPRPKPKRGMRPSWRHASNGLRRPANVLAVGRRRRPRVPPRTRIKSTSPMRIRASCRYLAVASTKPTTRKLRSTPIVCWS